MQIKKISIVMLFTLFLTASCRKEGGKQHDDAGQPAEYTLTEQASCFLPDVGILYPKSMCVTDSCVFVISDEDYTHQVYLFDKNMRFLVKGIPVGMGPDDIGEATSVHRYGVRSIALYDSPRGKLCEIQGDSAGLHMHPIPGGEGMLDDLMAISSDRLLRVPVASEYSYELTDTVGNLISASRYFPPKPKDVSDFTHSLACTGWTAFQPESNVFARCVAYDGGIDFFKIECDTIRHFHRHAIFDMAYGTVHANVDLPTPIEESRTGYTSVTCSKERFYAMFSPEKTSDNPMCLSREIHVFTPDGKHTSTLKFPSPVMGFDVSADGKELYALVKRNDNDDFSLALFRLP